jgi:hypothetical protein
MKDSKTLLNEFGVKFKEDTGKVVNYDTDEVLCENGKSIEVSNNGDNEKVTGYCGFFTIFDFSDEGKFLIMGAWE